MPQHRHPEPPGGRTEGSVVSELPPTSSQPLRVLLAEDDAGVREMLAVGLELEGIEVELAVDGVEAVVAFDPDRHDAVLADLMMPRGSGMSVLRAIRKLSDVPVLIMSAHHDSAHRVVALEAGADDFICKPMECREVALRIQRLVHARAATATAEPSPVLCAGPLEIRPEERRVTLDGRELELTAKELDLLTVLARTPAKVFSRAELLKLVWSSNPDWQSVDTVTEHIYRLRAKLDGHPSAANLIQTIRGAGYRLSA
jgi:DNA-binding response OmpR family regulator